jgi:hypothetical protein
MSKVKKMEKPMITEEQLKTVNDQQSKLSELLRTLGVLDVQKMNVHDKVKEISKEIELANYHIERNANAKIVLTDLSIKLTRLLHLKKA